MQCADTTQLNDVRRLQRNLASRGNGGSKSPVHFNDWNIMSCLALVFVPLAYFLRLALWFSHLHLPLTKNRLISDWSSTGKRSPPRLIHELIISPTAQPAIPAAFGWSGRFPSNSPHAVRTASCEESEIHEVLEYCLAHFGMLYLRGLG
jgi:hypothetical protein